MGQVQKAADGFLNDSTYVQYFGSGKPRTISHFKDGLLQGPMWEFHASGQVLIFNEWLEGQKHGEEKEYDQIGRLTHVTTWRYGRLHGEERTYYATSVLQSRIPWVNNQKE